MYIHTHTCVCVCVCVCVYKVSLIEIYNEQVLDLLNGDARALQVLNLPDLFLTCVSNMCLLCF